MYIYISLFQVALATLIHLIYKTGFEVGSLIVFPVYQ